MADLSYDGPFEHLLRELAPQVLGAVARRLRDFSSAEDAVQEAMIAAFTQWPQEGVSDNPRGWLTIMPRLQDFWRWCC
jgi:predicted RNA polymerase sigma factor